MKSAFSGLRAWLVQRFTAVFLLLFILFILGRLIFDRPQTYDAWRSWLAGSGMRIALPVFFTALLLHAWVGLRDVTLDYVKPLAARTVLLALLALSLAALGIWVVQIMTRT